MTAIDTDFLPKLDAAERYSWRRREAAAPSGNHLLRATAKKIAQSKHKHACEAFGASKCYGVAFSGLPAQAGACQYSADSKYDARHNFEHFLWYSDMVQASASGRSGRQRRRNHPRDLSDPEEDISLARSSVVLPSDGARRRTPSLERQDAFLDTSSRKVRVYKAAAADEDAQIAQLYEAGLLYDEAGGSQQPMTLDSIVHDEPVYPIRIIKAARKNGKRGGGNPKTAAEHNAHLSLDLSYSNIGDDERILSLASSPLSEAAPGPAQRTRSSSPPLRIVYELGSPTDLDIDASQPPDLEYDRLSDVDMDLDELPSQEVHADEHADPPADAWVFLGDGR